MDPHNPTPPNLAAGGHELDSSTAAYPIPSSITTTPPTTSTATVAPTSGVPTSISPPSPPTTPIVITSNAGGTGPWPRPATPGPPPTLPDRIFSFGGTGTPPHTPILGSNIPYHSLSPHPVANNSSGESSHHFDNDTWPGSPPDIFEQQNDSSGATHPVLRLRCGVGLGEIDGNAENITAMASLDEIVNSSGFQIDDPAGEDFYADTDVGSGSEATSLSSLWASRAYLDSSGPPTRGDVGESVQIEHSDHEHHDGNDHNLKGGNGKQKADDGAYGDPDGEYHPGDYISDSADEAPRRAGPFVPSFHDSQATPVKRGSFLFRNGYGVENDDVHERGGDVEGEASVPAGCELEFPLVPGAGENHGINDEGARSAPPRSEREIHRLPVPAPVCVRRPPAAAASYRGRRRDRTPSLESTPDPSVIQLLTPQGRIGAQFNNVADVQVRTEIGLLGGGYGMREIFSNGGCDEIRRGWGGVKGCAVEFKGGDKWELNLKERAANLSNEGRKRRRTPSGIYDGDDEGTIGAASDTEDAVAEFNIQPTSQDFILGLGEIKPYIIDVIDDDPNKAVSRYRGVADYSVNLRRTDSGNSFRVLVRDLRGSLVVLWKSVSRVEIILVGGVAVDINAGDGKEDGGGDGEIAAGDVGLRGGADKNKTGEPSQGEGDSGSSRHGDSSREVGSSREGSSSRSEAESGEKEPKRTAEDKGKGRALDDGDATPGKQYGSDSENHGSIPLCYEAPADYVQTLGPPHRIENPEHDYVLGSCPCLDHPITDNDTNAGAPQCTCIRPTSPESRTQEPWAGGYFSARYQEFLSNGPPNEPYKHSCTAHSESHGEWATEARRNFEENIANQASGSGVAAGTAPSDGASSLLKPLGASPGEDVSTRQGDDSKEERKRYTGNSAPANNSDEQPETSGSQRSQNYSHIHANQPDNGENEGATSTNVDREAAIGHTTRGNTVEGNTPAHNTPAHNTPAHNTPRGNTTGRGQPQAYNDRHASGLHSFPGSPHHLPTFYSPHPPPSPFHVPGQPTITTIQFFPPHEFPSIHYQHPSPGLHAPFTHYNPFTPHPQNSHPHYHPQTVHQPTSTFPEVPESNYFYPVGRSARLRSPTPPEQAAGQQQSRSSHETAPVADPPNSAHVTQETVSQPAPPLPSSRGYHSRTVEERMVKLMGAFELLRDMHIELAQRLNSGRW